MAKHSIIVGLGILALVAVVAAGLASYHPYVKQEIPQQFDKEAALAKADNVTTVLVVTQPDGKVQMQEFSAISKCTEAATYIKVGTTRGVIAECVKK